MKDTCAEWRLLRKRLELTAESSLALFPAQLHFLPQAVAAGAPGFCGCAANLFPAACGRLVTTASWDAEMEELYRRVSAAYELTVEAGFRGACKFLLRRRGLCSAVICRSQEVDEAGLERTLLTTTDPRSAVLLELLEEEG